ncbi:MAG: deoxynucleoside kinase [Simkaniaceae bacterium]|nr:deoxynucleoside kinase [Simkaniaceae bacterium]
MRLIGLFLLICVSLHGGGKLIALAGLTGSGKSTMTRQLAELVDGKAFFEPEEEGWPEVARNWERYGLFSRWMSFREMWLKSHYSASAWRNEGGVAILDTLFNKLLHHELDVPGTEWLFDPSDEYYSVFREICRLDQKSLPDPDVLVFLEVNKETWLSLLETRHREFDMTKGLIESYAPTLKALRDSAIRLCEERGIELIFFEQKFGDPKLRALELKELLNERGFIK